MLKHVCISLVCTILFIYNAQAQNLDFYLTAGIKNSPLLKDYNNQILSESSDSSIILSNQRLKIDLASQVMVAPTAKNFGYDEAITNGGNYAAVISAIQPLFIKNQKNNQLKNIQLNSESISVNKKITESELKKSITDQYLTAYSKYNQLQFNKTVLKLLQDEQAILKLLVEKGIYLQTDYMNLSVSVKNQEISIKQNYIQYKNNLAILNDICGISDTLVQDLQYPELNLHDTLNTDNSPVMQQFKIDSLKNSNSHSQIDMDYKPRLSAFADAGFMSIIPKNIPYNFGTSFGLNFIMPIYDGKQRKKQHDKISLAEDTRLNYQEFYKKQFEQKHNQLIEQLELTKDLISEIKSQLAEQEKLIALYKIEIEKGLVRFVDFLAVVNAYAATKNNLTQAEINRLQIINVLNYLK
jgi:outer membrane protein TolC